MIRTAALVVLVVAALAGFAGWLLLPEGSGALPEPTAPRGPSTAGSSPAAPDARSPQGIKTEPYVPPSEAGPGSALPAGPPSRGPKKPGGPDRPADTGSLSLSIIVRQELGPVPGGTAWLLATTGGEPPEELDWSRRPKARSQALDKDGAAVFTDLAPDRYVVGVDVGRGLSRESDVQLAAQGGPRRVIFSFGESRLEGRIINREGNPASGARVQVSWTPGAKQPASSVWTEALPDGRYAFAGLPSGPCVLSACLSGRRWAKSDRLFRRIELVAGETQLEDLDAKRGIVRWTGVLKTRSKIPARGAGTLFLTPAAGGAAAAPLPVPITDDGRFAATLQPGTWDCRIHFATHPAGDTVSCGIVPVGTTDFDQDLEIPGATVLGTVFGRDGGPAQAAGVSPPSVALRIAAESADRWYRTAVGPDGTFMLCGMPAGRFDVEVPGWMVVTCSAPGGVLDLRASDAGARLELVVEPK